MQSEAIRIVSNLCEGRRVVELKELEKNLKCCQYKKVLCLERITNERRFGLHSSLSILCDKCDVLTLVAAVDNETFKNHADVNIKAVLGAVHTGIRSTALNKILACLNIPTISDSLFKRYEREVGPAIEKIAKESCQRAEQEERQLVIENLDKLCQNLPSEIINEIYPYYKNCCSDINANPFQLSPHDDTLINSRSSVNVDNNLGNIEHYCLL